MDIPGVYILRSLKNERFYVGSTNNTERRVEEHNQGLVTATRFLIPLKLVRFIECESLQKARANEYRLKKYKSKKILSKVVESGIFPWEYTNNDPRFSLLDLGG